MDTFKDRRTVQDLMSQSSMSQGVVFKSDKKGSGHHWSEGNKKGHFLRLKERKDVFRVRETRCVDFSEG